MKVGDRVKYNRHFKARFKNWPDEMDGIGEIVGLDTNDRTGRLMALVDWEDHIYSCAQSAAVDELELYNPKED